jgi:hypothetical protein
MKRTWFPDIEQLVRLAATVSHGRKRNAAEAVAYVLELYREAEDALQRAIIEEGVVPEYVAAYSLDMTFKRMAAGERLDEWKKTVPKPESFPATLEDFSRLIVKAKTPADCAKRLRDFLGNVFSLYPFPGTGESLAMTTPEDSAIMQIQKIKDADKDGGFFTESKWLVIAGRYSDWWKQQRSSKSRESASKRKRSPASKRKRRS